MRQSGAEAAEALQLMSQIAAADLAAGERRHSGARKLRIAPAGAEHHVPNRQDNREIAAHRAVEGLACMLDRVVQAVVLLTAGIVITVNLLVDILYAYVDPRIRYG